MKKILFLLLGIFFASNMLFADEVSVQQALRTAARFVAHNATNPKNKKTISPLSVEPQLAHTVKSQATGKANLYIISLGEQKGFVIVSGESDTQDDILGYCDRGSFSYHEAPPLFKSLLDSYAIQIDSIRSNPSLRSPKLKSTYSGIGSVVVGPLLTTRWSQHAPYNNMCPHNAMTGCVPTAVAQVMNYWKWPKETKGKVKGEDFSGRSYDWDNMLDSYNTYNSAQAAAVAKLMADIGKAFDTKYNQPNGSPSLFYKVPLYENFGYEPDIETHTGATAAELQTIMKAELNLNRPILYCGAPSTGGNAHALVCDGYTSYDYFHFNYGWGGYYDGFYKNALTLLFPNKSIIFTKVRPYDAQEILIGDIKYGLLKNGTAEILDYNRKWENGIKLEIPSVVTDNEGNTYKVNRIRQYAFMTHCNFSKVIMGEHIEAVDPFSFIHSTIDTLILSDKMVKVPDEAFQLTKVNNLTIGASIKYIGKKAFFMCNLSRVTSRSKAFEVGEEAFFLSTPDCGEWLGCITKLGPKAFSAARFRAPVHFTNLEEIGSEAFTSTTLKDGNFHVYPKLKKIAPDAFKASTLHGFTVSEESPYFTINGYAILLNKNKTKLAVLAGCNYDIGDRSLPFPKSMIKMDPGSIMSRRRYGANLYFGVTIPASVVEMEGAFALCETLGSLTSLAVVPPIITDSTFNNKIFENNPNIPLIVPKGSEALYREAPGWRRFKQIVGDQEEYQPISVPAREYHMVLHGSNKEGQRINIPVSDIEKMEINENEPFASLVISRHSGNITTDVAVVDSITWMRGFVYENAEVFELNDSTRSVEAQKCAVRFDATTIEQEVQLCIRNAVFSPQINEKCVRGLAVDIALSNDVHELSGTAEITIPIQYGANEKVQAAYFHQESGKWEPVYFRYDQQKQAVVITTDHLSTFCAFVIQNDNTSKARLELLYDECPLFFDLKEAANKMLTIVSAEDVDDAAVQAWKDDFGFWQSVGLDGGYSMLGSLGFSTEAVDNAVELVGDLGTAITIVDIINADLSGDDLGVASNTLKLVMSQATNSMASAVGTSAMQASMGVVAFIGVALEKLGTKVQEAKQNLFNKAYRFYYSKESKGVVGGQSKFGDKYYRTEKDWYEYFYPVFAKEGMTELKLRAFIEQSVRRYCDRFWEDNTEVYTQCMAEKDVNSIGTYLYPETSMMQEISDIYYAELCNGVLVSVFQAIKKNLEAQSMKRYHSAMKEYLAMINAHIGLRFSDSSWKEGTKSKYAGYKIRFTDIPSDIEDPERWQATIDDNGKAHIGYFTIYALIKNNVRCCLTLLDPEGEEKACYEFKIPAGSGKIVCDIDLATGESTNIVPKLKNLELAYDPAEIEIAQKWIGTAISMGSDVVEPYDGGTSCKILLNNGFNKRARFQSEIEKYFKRHDFIVVDHTGNIRIGDDIVGKMEETGLQGKGKFTLKTSHAFDEKTVNEFLRNIKKELTPQSIYSLLNGTIEHKIECEFIVTRSSNNSEEFFVTYTGTGSYKLKAEVIDTIEKVHVQYLDIEFGNVTLDDISTRQIEAEGKVKLQYQTKLQ